MPANSPYEVANLIGQGLSTGDLDGIMALYEPRVGASYKCHTLFERAHRGGGFAPGDLRPS